ncbi:MAG: two-component regulator propeller domain-containing protein [Candidatus Cryptobacteroides sp.]
MNIPTKLACAACALVSILSCSQSDTPPEWPEREGVMLSSHLSGKAVRAFGEDRLGQIWIGTSRGLVKYTVDTYKYYNSTDISMIPDDQIQCICRSSDGKLLIGTMSGAAIYNEDDTFTSIGIPMRRAVSNIFEVEPGRMAIDCYGALFEYRPEDGSLREVVPTTGDSRFVTAQDGKLWKISYNSIVSYDADTYTVADSLASPIIIYHSALDKNGDMWLSGLGELALFDTHSARFKNLPEAVRENKTLMGADVDYIFVMNDGRILFNTIGKGLFCYHPSEDRLLHSGNPGFPLEVPEFRISTIFQDSEDNVWFGSYDQGFSVSYTGRNRFNNDKILSSAFAGKSVKSLVTDREGNLWIATLNDGLYVYNHECQSLDKIELDRYMDTQYGYIQCTEVFCDSKGYIWIVLSGKGYILKGRYGKGRFILDRKFFFYGAQGLSEDTHGNMWTGSFGNLMFKLPAGEDTWVPVSSGVNGWTFINSPLPLENGSVLVSPFGTIPRTIDPESSAIDTTLIPREKLEPLLGGRMFIENDHIEDSHGDIWIGTLACGLLHYDRSTGELSRIGGLPSNDISAIIEDGNSDIWISTGRGLAKWNRENGRITSFFEEDGIGGDEFCDRSACLAWDGSIVFGGTHGITVVNPRDIGQRREVPIVFDNLHIRNKLVFPGEKSPIPTDLALNPPITLRHNQNSIRISFAALDYSSRIKTRYSYKMEGYDKYWIESGSTHYAFYANLPAGKYTFRVKVSGDNKDLAETENSISVTVRHAPWDTPLAWICYFLIAGGIAITIIAQRRHAAEIKKEAERQIMEQKLLKEQADKEKAREERLNKMQMSFFSNVSHEFRTPLTMISGPVSLLAKSDGLSEGDRQLVKVIETSSEWMLRLVNQLLDFNKLENDTLRLQVARKDVSGVLAKVASIFVPNARTKHIAYTTSGIDVPAIACIDADKITKIVINLLSNAMKFTSASGEVHIDFDVVGRSEAAESGRLTESDTDTLWTRIVVSDTGYGVPDNMKERIFERYFQIDSSGGNGSYNWGTGIGLYYARALARLHHGYLFVSDRSDGTSGSVFTLLVPASATSYSASEMAPGRISQIDAFPISPAMAAVEDAPDESEDAGKPLILVVDDDIDVANYQKLLLSPYYRVIIRFEADGAMEYLKGQNEEPDLILCDVMMPGKDGYEMTRELRSDLQLSHIPVILVTAKAANNEKIEGLCAGADAYITKPFDPEYLLTLIKTTLERISDRRRSIGQAAPEKVEDCELSPQDKAFMSELYALMDSELSNPELDIVGMSAKMKISRTKFYYKVKGLTGEAPSVFFKKYKLNIAAGKLLEGKYNMSEIADMTGFSSLSHFSTSFKQRFGVPPSSYKGEKPVED